MAIPNAIGNVPLDDFWCKVCAKVAQLIREEHVAPSALTAILAENKDPKQRTLDSWLKGAADGKSRSKITKENTTARHECNKENYSLPGSSSQEMCRANKVSRSAAVRTTEAMSSNEGRDILTINSSSVTPRGPPEIDCGKSDPVLCCAESNNQVFVEEGSLSNVGEDKLQKKSFKDSVKCQKNFNTSSIPMAAKKSQRICSDSGENSQLSKAGTCPTTKTDVELLPKSLKEKNRRKPKKMVIRVSKKDFKKCSANASGIAKSGCRSMLTRNPKLSVKLSDVRTKLSTSNRCRKEECVKKRKAVSSAKIEQEASSRQELENVRASSDCAESDAICLPIDSGLLQPKVETLESNDSSTEAEQKSTGENRPKVYDSLNPDSVEIPVKKESCSPAHVSLLDHDAVHQKGRKYRSKTSSKSKLPTSKQFRGRKIRKSKTGQPKRNESLPDTQLNSIVKEQLIKDEKNMDLCSGAMPETNDSESPVDVPSDLNSPSRKTHQDKALITMTDGNFSTCVPKPLKKRHSTEEEDVVILAVVNSSTQVEQEIYNRRRQPDRAVKRCVQNFLRRNRFCSATSPVLKRLQTRSKSIKDMDDSSSGHEQTPGSSVAVIDEDIKCSGFKTNKAFSPNLSETELPSPSAKCPRRGKSSLIFQTDSSEASHTPETERNESEVTVHQIAPHSIKIKSDYDETAECPNNAPKLSPISITADKQETSTSTHDNLSGRSTINSVDVCNKPKSPQDTSLKILRPDSKNVIDDLKDILQSSQVQDIIKDAKEKGHQPCWVYVKRHVSEDGTVVGPSLYLMKSDLRRPSPK